MMAKVPQEKVDNILGGCAFSNQHQVVYNLLKYLGLPNQRSQRKN